MGWVGDDEWGAKDTDDFHGHGHWPSGRAFRENECLELEAVEAFLVGTGWSPSVSARHSVA